MLIFCGNRGERNVFQQFLSILQNNDTDSEFNWAAAESLSPEKQQKKMDSKVLIHNSVLPQTNPPTCPQLVADPIPRPGPVYGNRRTPPL